ncbi:MAG: hypothetical protein ABFR95_10580, partial [Actinomycetota bacterium]
MRAIPAVLAVCLLAAACVPNGTSPDTTDAEQPTTTSDTPDTTTTTRPLDEEPLDAPTVGDPNQVASDAFWDAGAFTTAEAPTQFEEDALTAIEQWLPEDLVDGLIWEVFTDHDGLTVLAVSVLPELVWRGDPNFLPLLIASLNEADAIEVRPGIYETEIAGGLVIDAWSTGDGFIVAASVSTDSSVAYLEALASETPPQTVWEPGTCLYVDPENRTLPYAPFPPDIVVPCDGPHNAEVIA